MHLRSRETGTSTNTGTSFYVRVEQAQTQIQVFPFTFAWNRHNISFYVRVEQAQTQIQVLPLCIFSCILDRLLNEALPGVLGIQGEGLFIFRDLGRRVIYFQGFGEKAGF